MVAVVPLGAAGKLLELDEVDITVKDNPIDIIREYLMRKYDARFEVEPYKFEDVVASVYRDFGYSASVTAKIADGGIDVVLEKALGERVGVQVKRHKGKITVEQIRDFTGALVMRGLTRGVFVTTSSFTKPAKKAAAQATRRGHRIELVDAERFYDALNIGRLKGRRRLDDPEAPFNQLQFSQFTMLEYPDDYWYL